jgi:hypothetical protein
LLRMPGRRLRLCSAAGLLPRRRVPVTGAALLRIQGVVRRVVPRDHRRRQWVDDPGATRREDLSCAGPRHCCGAVELEALAVPVSPARPGPQARSTDRARAVAAGDRRGSPGRLPARAVPLGREPDRQLGQADRERSAEALRLPTLGVRQPVPTTSSGCARGRSTCAGSVGDTRVSSASRCRGETTYAGWTT